jgi:hypothetical protein
MKKILSILILGMFLISFASASLSSKVNENYDLKVYCLNDGYCDSTASCNITIENPDNNIILDNIQLENNINYHNYTISNLSLDIVGKYHVTGFCQEGILTKKIDFTFDVSLDGNSLPTGNERILFIILFIFIVVTMLYFLFKTIFRMISWDFDAEDLIFNISLYFGIFVTYILSKSYLGNQFVDEFLVWLIGVGAFTTVVLPLIAFFMSIVKGNLKQNE